MSSRAYRRCIKIYAFGSAHRCDPLDPHQQPITIVTTAHMQLFVSRSFFQLLSLQPQCPACGRKWRDLHGQRCRASGSKKREASNCARGILGCIHNHSSDAGLWLLLTVAVRTRVGHAVWTPSQSSSHRTPFRPSSDVEHPSSRPYTTSQTVRNGTFHPYDLRWSAKGISHWTTGGWQSRKS